jgi:hypothetical protein
MVPSIAENPLELQQLRDEIVLHIWPSRELQSELNGENLNLKILKKRVCLPITQKRANVEMMERMWK